MFYYLSLLKNIFNFKDKVSLNEYWDTITFSFLIHSIFLVLLNLIFPMAQALFTQLILTLIIISLIASFSLHIRRLNDIGMSKLYSLLLFIPFANLIFIFFIMTKNSKCDECENLNEENTSYTPKVSLLHKFSKVSNLLIALTIFFTINAYIYHSDLIDLEITDLNTNIMYLRNDLRVAQNSEYFLLNSIGISTDKDIYTYHKYNCPNLILEGSMFQAHNIEFFNYLGASACAICY